MKRSTSSAHLFIAFVFAMSVSCASPHTASETVKTVAFITNTTSDFWKIARKGSDKADAELADVKVEFKSTNTGAVKEQDRLIRDSLNIDQADALAISLVDPVGQKPVINDAARGP